MDSTRQGFVEAQYSGATVLLTGATGFIGKVMLEKLLRTVPTVSRVYTLIRPLGSSTPAMRLGSSVRDSPAFDVIRSVWDDSPLYRDHVRPDGLAAPPQGSDAPRPPPPPEVAPAARAVMLGYGSFEEFFGAKVVALAGDLTRPALGLDADTIRELVRTVTVVLSVAASVAFDNPLPEAINLNIRGQLELFDMIAGASDVLQVFTHISTAYVGSNREPGPVPEGDLPVPAGDVLDPEAEYAALLATADSELVARQSSIIGNYPNTYTYTKALAERVLHSRLSIVAARRSILLVTVRPTIVGAAYAQPFPGWVDTVSAGGALYLAAGVGALRFGEGNPDIVGDQVPVDYVSNFVLAVGPALVAGGHATVPAGPGAAPAPPQEFIFHCGSSYANPVTWRETGSGIIAYWHAHPPAAGFRTPQFMMHTGPVTMFRKFLEYVVPAGVARLVAALAPTASNKATADAAGRLNSQTSFLISAFQRFMTHEWIFETKESDATVVPVLASEPEWYVDVRSVHWPTFLALFGYGLQRYVLGEPVRLASPPTLRPPSLLDEAIMETRASHAFDTSVWAASAPLELKTYASPMPGGLTPAAVKAAVQGSAELRSLLRSLASSKAHYGQLKRAAKAELDAMASEMAPGAMRLAAWLLRMVCTRVYAGIQYATHGVSVVRELARSQAVNLVYLPSHRSYFDFILLSYLAFQVGLPVPHIAATGDFLSTPMVASLMRAAGAFFIKRSGNTDPVYRAVLADYIRTILDSGAPLEFFVEGSRSRSGKPLAPRTGLLKILMTLAMRDDAKPIILVPISISFERLIETPLYAAELDGAPKVRESFAGALAGLRTILDDDYGRVMVNFGAPLALSDLTGPNGDDAAAVAASVATAIDAGMVVYPTHLLAAVLLGSPGPVATSSAVRAMDALRTAVMAASPSASALTREVPIVESGLVSRAAALLSQHILAEPELDTLAAGPGTARLALMTYKNALISVLGLDALLALTLTTAGDAAVGTAGALAAQLLQVELGLQESQLSPAALAQRASTFTASLLEDADLRVLLPSLVRHYVVSYAGVLTAIVSLTNVYAPSETKARTIGTSQAVLERARALVTSSGSGAAYEARSADALKSALARTVSLGWLTPRARRRGRSGPETWLLTNDTALTSALAALAALGATSSLAVVAGPSKL